MPDQQPTGKLLIANRGEIAVRIHRTAREMGIETVGVHPADDSESLHAQTVDESVQLEGTGAAAYLDIEQIVGVARGCGCRAIHPGYGFLAENAEFAQACEAAGIVFVGPSARVLRLFGDKLKARDLAAAEGLPVLPASAVIDGADQAEAFYEALQPNGTMILKAVAGGGGRGMRVIHRKEDIAGALVRGGSEAKAAFGSGALYAERLIERALHIEVQVLGDRHGHVGHLGERDCSIQRRHQKVVEVAPSPQLDPALRERILESAVTLADAAGYDNIGTFEFLVDGADLNESSPFYFIEANPRIQVEHTVTEAVTGVDLVRTQLAIADGAALPDLGLDNGTAPTPRGHAIQLRINMEKLGEDGVATPRTGTLTAFRLPQGPGVRVDTFGYEGYRTSGLYDSLLAKLIVHSGERGFADAVNRAETVQDEYPEGFVPVRAAMPSTMVTVSPAVGDEVLAGQELIVLNAMKMEHVVKAPVSGTVSALNVAQGDTVPEGTVLLVIEEGTVEGEASRADLDLDLDTPRPDLAEVIRRRALTTDASRTKQVAKRHAQGGRTARENIHDLADDGTFVQYGSLAVGMGLHGTVDELLDYAPSDGLVMGLGHVNGEKFDESRSRCVLMSYDYSVLAGSQGGMNHKMMDRMFQTAAKLSSPLVLFTEGGGGRAGGGSRNARPGRGGSPQISGGGGLNTPSWTLLSKLSGRVPVVGVNAGFCFAGNAVLLGCCDVIIATANSSIGIGGPAMIEGGGLGVYSPEEVGPMSVQIPSGVVDIPVEDEAEAVQVTKKYLSYFQGVIDDWETNDQRLLRHVIPENRLRVYDIRELIDILADKDSVLELRPEFGTAMITSLIRIEGRPMGVIANNPAVISGAIDSDAADKAARFMKTCDSFQIPLLLLCDCPGIMVGPEVEKTGLVRHAARMFVIGANIEVPSYMVILRKAYGLGAQAMGGGNQRLPAFVVAWPTSEFGGMGLEGQVKLGQRARLEAIEDLAERQAAYERMVEGAYNRGKGLNAGHVFEVDDVIDPADTRRWIVAGMKANAPPSREVQTRVPFIDAW